jgi:hypothetical protein
MVGVQMASKVVVFQFWQSLAIPAILAISPDQCYQCQSVVSFCFSPDPHSSVFIRGKVLIFLICVHLRKSAAKVFFSVSPCLRAVARILSS